MSVADILATDASIALLTFFSRLSPTENAFVQTANRAVVTLTPFLEKRGKALFMVRHLTTGAFLCAPLTVLLLPLSRFLTWRDEFITLVAGGSLRQDRLSYTQRKDRCGHNLVDRPTVCLLLLLLLGQYLVLVAWLDRVQGLIAQGVGGVAGWLTNERRPC